MVRLFSLCYCICIWVCGGLSKQEAKLIIILMPLHHLHHVVHL